MREEDWHPDFSREQVGSTMALFTEMELLGATQVEESGFLVRGV